NGTPLPGVLVSASGGLTGAAVTVASGAYTLTAVPPNPAGIVLTPGAAGHGMAPPTRPADGPPTFHVTGPGLASTPANVVLTIQASHGSVARSPNQGSYVPGTPVTLTPTPDSGYSFGGWSGAVPPGHELDNPLQVTMDVNRTIAASFLRPSVTA